MRPTDWHLPDPDTQHEFYDDVPLKRLIAFVIDTVLIVLIGLAILPFTAFAGVFFFPFLLTAVGFAYRVISLANRSATPGMWLTAIEFRTGDGRRFDLSTATLHTLGLTISFAIPLLQVISVVLMATSANGQGLSDRMLGTVALNRAARR
ncbi:RDD family protein [Thalassovita mangrovi]|uniref:RDD family protein n=1 Tax=Thalassovita mangrovi TaxID=2692236 RepID=A0A6L8LJG2_9RHOB|nr:RDD family protein [Thalassovita mangrovi]MYM55793.1 RDD family protein [Thalassovita mangrovi]